MSILRDIFKIRFPLRISIVYLLVAAIWILTSDRIVEALFVEKDTLSAFQTAKGWGFVIVNAILLYLWTNRHTKKLEQANQEYRLLFEQNPQPMWTYDPETLAFTDANHEAVRHYGYTRDEFLQMSLKDIRPKDDIPALLADVEARPTTRKIWKHMKKDGTLIDVEVIANSIYLDQKEVRLVLAHDVTERKQVEQARLESERLSIDLEKEKELRELKNRFISMASHEYRNPLAAIMLSTDLLNKYWYTMTDDKRNQHLSKIRNRIEYMTSLIDDVLTIGRMETDRIDFSPTDLELDELCEDIVREYTSISKDTHVIEYSKNGDCFCIQADENLMRQIVTNLLSNAVKYSPNGGTVRVDLACDENHVILTVADQGIGIPQDDQQRLFETFHRAGNVSQISGSGLGLAIVKQAVETHGGTIQCESEVDVGSTFTIRLPLMSE